jgi:large subunit ribosomal protein L19
MTNAINIINTIPAGLESRKDLDFSSGDVIRVNTIVREANGKTRVQVFEGLVICRKHGTTPGATFTVRKTASGVDVERIFPLYSMNIESIEKIRTSETRKSKLYYVRDKAARDVRRKLKGTKVFVKENNKLPESVEEVDAVIA